MAETPTEALLVERASQGDQSAVATLYDAYAPTLYAFGVRRLGDSGLAEQLVQDVMTRVWRRADTYDPDRGEVRTWVFAIARSVVVDIHRRRRWAVPSDELPVSSQLTDELDDLLDAELVRTALSRITPEHREVLELGYLRGLTRAEIARRLGIPVGTVKSRAFYALKAFRLACDELGVRP